MQVFFYTLLLEHNFNHVFVPFNFGNKKSMEQFGMQKSWLLRGSRDMRTVPLKKPEIPIKNHNPLVLVKKKKIPTVSDLQRNLDLIWKVI